MGKIRPAFFTCESRPVPARPVMSCPPPQPPPVDAVLNLVPRHAMARQPIRLRLLHHHGGRTAPLAGIGHHAAHNHGGHSPQVLDGEGGNPGAHVPHGDLAAVDLDGAAEVLELDHAGLEIHEQAGPELVLGAGDLALLEAGEARLEGQGTQFLAHDVEHGGGVAGEARGRDAKEARVGVGVVEGDAGFDPAELVEDVGVQARVHALSGPAGREGAAAAEDGLQRGERVDVVGADGEPFKREVDVGEFGVVERGWLCR